MRCDLAFFVLAQKFTARTRLADLCQRLRGQPASGFMLVLKSGRQAPHTNQYKHSEC
jgi:hypothetical protein